MKDKKQPKKIITASLVAAFLLILAIPVVLKGSTYKGVDALSNIFSGGNKELAKENADYNNQVNKELEEVEKEFSQLDNDLESADLGINAINE